MSKKDARKYIEGMITGMISCRFCKGLLDDCPDECLCNENRSSSFRCSKDGLKQFQKEFKEELDK